MSSQRVGGRSQNFRDSRVVREDEGRQELRHVGDAAPFVAREQPHRQPAFGQALILGI